MRKEGFKGQNPLEEWITLEQISASLWNLFWWLSSQDHLAQNNMKINLLSLRIHHLTIGMEKGTLLREIPLLWGSVLSPQLD